VEHLSPAETYHKLPIEHNSVHLWEDGGAFVLEFGGNEEMQLWWLFWNNRIFMNVKGQTSRKLNGTHYHTYIQMVQLIVYFVCNSIFIEKLLASSTHLFIY
jgi:hypothetical protein